MDELSAGLLKQLTITGHVKRDATAFFAMHDFLPIVRHSARVAAEARYLAQRFGLDPDAAEQAGWLHDISVIIPNDQRIAYAEAWQIEILPEERQAPMIIHQKLSAYMAQTIFHVDDPAVLSAIGCHTTLKAHATPLDQVVFIADKLRWDGVGDPPYLAELQESVEESLSAGIDWFIRYLWERRESLLVIHPWLADAYHEHAQLKILSA